MQRQRRPQYNAATIVGATPLPSSTCPRRGGTNLVPSYRDAWDASTMAQHDGQPTNHEAAAGTQTSEEEEEGVIGVGVTGIFGDQTRRSVGRC